MCLKLLLSKVRTEMIMNNNVTYIENVKTSKAGKVNVNLKRVQNMQR